MWFFEWLNMKYGYGEPLSRINDAIIFTELPQ